MSYVRSPAFFKENSRRNLSELKDPNASQLARDSSLQRGTSLEPLDLDQTRQQFMDKVRDGAGIKS